MSDEVDAAAAERLEKERELARMKTVQEEARKFEAEQSKTFSPLRAGRLRSLAGQKTVELSGKLRDFVSEEEVVVDVATEYKILEEAHRVLLEKQSLSARSPAVREKEFIDYTSVREMLDEMGRPVLATIPAMQAQLSQFRTDVAHLREAISRTKADISMFASRTQDLGELSKAL